MTTRVSRGHTEVDVIAEAASGQVFGVEVKAGLTLTERDFRHLATIKAKLGSAIPLGALWAELPGLR